MKQNPYSMCHDCQYFRGAKRGICDAFPDEIPNEIWSGKVKHDKPFPGDRGIRFKPGDKSQFLSVSELAKLLNVDQKTVYRALWSKKLPAYKIGRMWRVSPKDVQFIRR
jgi:excisionase family DNA binding protein